MAPLRVLALCGFSQNASTFAHQVRKSLLAGSKDLPWTPFAAETQKHQVLSVPEAAAAKPQLGSIVKAGPAAEFVFLDPTVVLTKEQLPAPQLKELEAYEQAMPAGNATPRCWWTAPDRKTYLKYDDTVRYLHSYLSTNAPFDGVIGFSQGAALAAAVAALLEKPGLHPDFQSHPNLQPLKFAIAVGGFKPRSESPDFSAYFPLQTPTLHVIGKADPIVSEKASKQLVDACPNSRIEYHNGGHIVPSSQAWQDFFSAFISKVGAGGKLGDVPPLASFEKAKL